MNRGLRLLEGCVDRSRRFALVVVGLAVLLTGLSGWYVVGAFAISTDTTDMLSPDLPFRQRSKAFDAAFPDQGDSLLVVVDGANADLADDAALALGATLRARPELFHAVRDLAGEPFFRRAGLLYLDEAELQDLGTRLSEAQPFLGTLWRDPSLRGLAGLLGLAVDQVLRDQAAGATVPFPLERVFADMAEVTEAVNAGRFARLSWTRLMRGEETAGDRRRFLVVEPALDHGSLSPAGAAMRAVREAARSLGLTPEQGVRVRLTGSVALDHEELGSVEEGMGLAGLLSLALVLALLVWCFLSARMVFAILATLLMGLAWTAALAFLAVGELNLISVAFAVLFIGLSVDFGIHLALRYREDLDGGSDHAAALRAAARGVGGGLALSAVAAAIAFYAFLPTAYVGLAQLGLIAGNGMFVALLANLTVLPALLTLLPPRPRTRRPAAGRAVDGLVARHARPVVAGALVLGVAGLAVAPRAEFDFDPLHLKDPGTESVSTVLEVMADPNANPYALSLLVPAPGAAALAERFARLPEVTGTRTIADYLPADQDAKLALIGDLALVVAPAFLARSVPPPDAGERRAAVADLVDRLTRLAPTMPAAGRLGGALAAADDLTAVERALLAGLPRRLTDLRDALEAGPVTQEDLPEALRREEIALDGRIRLQVFPSGDMTDREQMRRFVAAARTIDPQVVGTPVTVLEAGDAVLAAFGRAGAIAGLAITVLLFGLLRRWRDLLLVYAPLGLAAVLTVAASALLGQPFNFANVIVLPLLFGLGTASGIHLVLRAREGADALLATSTPRAVVFSALTTCASFGSIALSSHPGTASMGVLLTVAIGLTLVCTLVVLPALLAVTSPAGRRPSR